MLLRNARTPQLSWSWIPLHLNYVPKRRSASSNSTKSILLEPDNPILNPGRYALHKARDGKTTWEHAANPYINMLASPMRRCMWSNRVMPRDFLLPLKAASFTAEDGKQKTSIFPRGLLHSSSLPASDSKGKKSARGYVVCLRNAMYDFVKRGSWMRLDPASESNPLLPFMVDSQLRRRVVQELEALQTRQGAAVEAHIQLAPFKQADIPKYLDQAVLQNGDAPTALLYYDRIGLSEGTPFSRLLPWYSENQPVGTIWKDLHQHRVPAYNLASLFYIPSHQADAVAGAEAEAAAAFEQATKKPANKGKAKEPPSDYLEFSKSYPEIYKREVELCHTLSTQSMSLLGSLAGNIARSDMSDSVFVIPGGERSLTPLLVALWRWRMWIGEGWEVEDANQLGFGMARATARTGRISVVA